MQGIDLSWVLSAAAFSLAMSATPGPNNAMVAASGATFGIRRTWWHMLGISVGFPVMMIGVALGAGRFLEQHPEVHEAMRWIGAAYMLWLAWHIASARPEAAGGGKTGRGRPLRFHEAALFQWINPKAWIMAITAIGTYIPQEDFLGNLLLLAPLFALVNGPSVGLWTVAGSLLRKLLQDSRKRRLFNHGMAMLLVLSLYPILAERGL